MNAVVHWLFVLCFCLFVCLVGWGFYFYFITALISDFQKERENSEIEDSAFKEVAVSTELRLVRVSGRK